MSQEEPVRVDPALSNSIQQLVDSFEEQGRRYPPIYTRVIETVTLRDVGPEGLTAAEWSAFLASASFAKEEWRIWEPVDEQPCICGLFGSSDGFDSYCRLAESACELVGTSDWGYSGGDWVTWTYLLRMIARDFPTPMLRLREGYWGCESGEADADELAQEWLETPGGESVPAHPWLQELPHDVFASSAIALKLMLQSDSLVETQLPNARADQWSPFGETAMGGDRRKDAEASKRPASSHESKEQKPPHQFFLRGDIYHIRYTEDHAVEEAEIKRNVNLDTCHRIVMNAHKSLSPPQALGLKDEIIRTNALAEESIYESMSLDEIQETSDALITRIEELKETGEDNVQLEGLTQELEEIKALQKKDRKTGRAKKRLPAGDHIKKSVAAVNKHRDRFKQELIEKKMPKFASHMMRYLDAREQTYRYTPPDDVEWVLVDLA